MFWLDWLSENLNLLWLRVQPGAGVLTYLPQCTGGCRSPQLQPSSMYFSWSQNLAACLYRDNQNWNDAYLQDCVVVWMSIWSTLPISVPNITGNQYAFTQILYSGLPGIFGRLQGIAKLNPLSRAAADGVVGVLMAAHHCYLWWRWWSWNVSNSHKVMMHHCLLCSVRQCVVMEMSLQSCRYDSKLLLSFVFALSSLRVGFLSFVLCCIGFLLCCQVKYVTLWSGYILNFFSSLLRKGEILHGQEDLVFVFTLRPAPCSGQMVLPQFCRSLHWINAQVCLFSPFVPNKSLKEQNWIMNSARLWNWHGLKRWVVEIKLAFQQGLQNI
jgi:hypothetical protein